MAYSVKTFLDVEFQDSLGFTVDAGFEIVKDVFLAIPCTTRGSKPVATFVEQSLMGWFDGQFAEALPPPSCYSRDFEDAFGPILLRYGHIP